MTIRVKDSVVAFSTRSEPDVHLCVPSSSRLIDASLSTMEAYVGQDKSFALYLEQLKFLHDVGILRRDSTVLNLFSGIDLYPVHYAGSMVTLDKRIQQRQIPEILSIIRTEVTLKLLDYEALLDDFPLPAGMDTRQNIRHFSGDVCQAGELAELLESLQAGDVVYLKQASQYFTAFSSAEAAQDFFGGLFDRLPGGVHVVLIENAVRSSCAGVSSLPQILRGDRRYVDAFCALSEAQRARLSAVNDRIGFRMTTLNVPCGANRRDAFQLMFAGKLEVFTRRFEVD